MERRGGYEFSLKQKESFRARASGRCEFPAEPCPKPNNNIVNHLTGIHLARLVDVPRTSVVSDDNSIVLCDFHKSDLDQQEAQIVRGFEPRRFARNTVWKRRGRRLR